MKNRLLFLLLFIVINVFGQDPKLSENFIVQVGEEYKDMKGRIKEIFNYEDYVISLKSRQHDMVVQKFDSETLEEVDRKEYPDFLKGIGHFQEIIRIGDNVVFFYAKWDRDAQVESLHAQLFSLKSLEVIDVKEVVNQQGKIARNSFSSFRVVNTVKSLFGKKYILRKSLSNNKLLITYRLKPEFRDDSKGKDRFLINVFDSKLDLIWKEQVEMPYTEKKMNNVDFAIDKNEDFYMLASVFDDDSTDEKKEKEKKANYHLEMFKVKKNTNVIVKNEIRIGNNFISQIMIYEDSDSNLVMAGTSKNPDKSNIFIDDKGQATGVFTVKLNKDGGVSDFNNYDFPLEMLQKYATGKEKKDIKKQVDDEEEKPTFENLIINKIVRNSDGSFLIIGEQKYVQTRNNANMQNMSQSKHVYRDILVTKINKDGLIDWMHRLPKRQITIRAENTLSMSYKFMSSGENHYLLYMDNIKNLDLPENKLPHRYIGIKKGFFTTYIINHSTGEVKKEVIFEASNIKGKEFENFVMRKVLKLSDSEILIEGMGRKKDRFLVKVTAKK
ncbi:hypothetical protein [uncultured Aquimarina sp.]|uniref:hypothetical protein n=1 Tax=uncultured Aquimarina sp. TaxID=575652 RepID=UPI002627C489|nr:hypothetical protein [uncultured Aquimarina sp.]